MVSRHKLLWVADAPVPDNVRQAIPDTWELIPYTPQVAMVEQMDAADLSLIFPNGAADDARQLGQTLDDLDRSTSVGVFLLPADAKLAWDLLSKRAGPFICVREDVPADELAAKLNCAADLQPTILSLRAEVNRARNAREPEDRAPSALTEEMRLAARLQRDFLPRRLPEVGPVRFGVLFRPAGWVSGDIYDVTRLDETRVGFYIADAVGHGLPAALLTMFIKRGLQTKRIVGNTYQIVPPHISLQELNNDICQQNLSDCQFCTAVYCVLDVRRKVLTCARAGHPEPVVIHADGNVETVKVVGSLLGVFPEETYMSQDVQLLAGDRVVLYSDGAEPALMNSPPGKLPAIQEAFGPFAGVPRDEMILQLTERLDRLGTPSTLDDATIMIVDVGE